MVVLVVGVALILLGALVPVPVLVTIGIIVAVLGVVLLFLSATGHAVGGRRW